MTDHPKEARVALNNALDLHERADVYEQDPDTIFAAVICRRLADEWKARARKIVDGVS